MKVTRIVYTTATGWRTILSTAALGVALCSTSALGVSYDVDDPADFAVMRANPSWDYTQIADIDLSSTTWTPIGSASTPFTGTFDGNGYTISNLTAGSCPDAPILPAELAPFVATIQIGLFGVTDGASIENVTLEDVDVGGMKTVGALIGDARTTTIESCSVDGGSVCAAGEVGGLIGFMADSDASNSWADVEVVHIAIIEIDYGVGTFPIDTEANPAYDQDSKWFGGFVGHAHPYDEPGRGPSSTGDGNIITNCHAFGDVAGSWGVGGFAGNIHGSVAINCSASGDVESSFTDTGGFVGFIQNEPGAETVNPVPRNTEIIGCSTSGRVIASSYGDGGFPQGIGKSIPGEGGFAGYCEGGLDDDDEPTVVIADCVSRGDTYTLEPQDNSPTGTGGFVGTMDRYSLIIHSRAFGDVFASGLHFLEGDPTDSLLDAGGFAGVASGSFENCIATGNVEAGSSVGGFVGTSNNGVTTGAYSGKYRNCEAHGDVVSLGAINTDRAGGFIGWASGTNFDFTDCEAHGNVSSVNSDTSNGSGGFVGEANGSTYSRCAALGDVIKGNGSIGGFAGLMSGSTTSSDSIAQGLVTVVSADSGDNAGGFAGAITSSAASVTDCYSSGLVTSAAGDVGGFVGESTSSPSYTTCYWDTDASGQSGSQPSGVSGLTTVNMRKQTSFTGFDFTNVWDIYETVSYPHLK